MLRLVTSNCLTETLRLAGRPVVLDCSGAMWLPEERLLVVSDLHFEKGSSYAAKGIPLPPYDTRATLDALERLVRLCRPNRILSLGDAFHDPQAEERMDEADAQRLDALCSAADWIWILGNHDPLPPKRFGGAVHQAAEVAGLAFVHEPGETDDWQVAGHLHPCAIAAKGGRGVRKSCFVTDGERLVMPAFGAFTGGLNVLDTAFAPHFGAGYAVFMLGETRVYQVPVASLRPDGRRAAWGV
ncbi:ligase-associated DNA damage response endonuclease PdeM [Parvularcula oceani]|uniref:ligase-associated DNA damage response endonuclease PdeM n=1 Tax=Parvularcula oceani TaxID=1247963 RepID=UPI0004E20CF5|nr:ligase-associated DNA damage response endonuclease PdeM [Parvularcula oceani]